MIKMYCIEKIITDLIYISGVSILTGALKGRKVLQDVMDRIYDDNRRMSIYSLPKVCIYIFIYYNKGGGSLEYVVGLNGRG